MEEFDGSWRNDGVEEDFGFRIKILGAGDVNFVDDYENEFVCEERFGGLEELDLCLDRVTALFGKIHEVENRGAEVGNCGDGLHFDSVHFFKWVIENTRGVYGLEAKVFVVEVANKQTLRCERVWLNIDICSCNTSEKTRLPDIGISANE